MRYSEQFTIEEAKAVAIANDNFNADSELYMQGEDWGSEVALGTKVDWENEIPANENKAKFTGYYDWFLSDERYFHGMTWEEYRDELLNKQLIEVEIVEEDDE